MCIRDRSIASLYQPKLYVAGRVSGTTIKVSTGTQTFTVTNPSTGNYTITWTTAHPSGTNYGVLITTSNNFYGTYTTLTTTTVGVLMYSSSGVASNNEFTFMTLP